MTNVITRDETVNINFRDIVRPIGSMLKDNSVMSHWVFLDLLKVAGRTVERLGKFGIFIEDLSLPCNMFESSELPKTGVTTIKAICKIISAHWIDFQEVQDSGGHFQMH